MFYKSKVKKQLKLSPSEKFPIMLCRKSISMNSPMIDKIEVNKVGKVRRARIFYLRGLTGKKARIKEVKK